LKRRLFSFTPVELRAFAFGIARWYGADHIRCKGVQTYTIKILLTAVRFFFACDRSVIPVSVGTNDMVGSANVYARLGDIVLQAYTFYPLSQWASILILSYSNLSQTVRVILACAAHNSRQRAAASECSLSKHQNTSLFVNA
jgi:hypothetical protein